MSSASEANAPSAMTASRFEDDDAATITRQPSESSRTVDCGDERSFKSSAMTCASTYASITGRFLLPRCCRTAPITTAAAESDMALTKNGATCFDISCAANISALPVCAGAESGGAPLNGPNAEAGPKP